MLINVGQCLLFQETDRVRMGGKIGDCAWDCVLFLAFTLTNKIPMISQGIPRGVDSIGKSGVPQRYTDKIQPSAIY